MRYISTRDVRQPPQRVSYSFIDAVLLGLAPDGGLLVPESVPSVSSEEWALWKILGYNDLCFVILRKFIDISEVTDAELLAIIASAYAPESGWRDERITPLRQVGQFRVLELFHGPTFAFKDVALQLLGHFFDFALRKKNSTMTILGATSGDTGSAAIAAVKGRANIGCVMLFPAGKTSKIQELQMTTNNEPNIHCLAVADSVFDDCQAIVKSCFNDSQFNVEMSLGAVNSINWCRILAQIVYYVHSAALCGGPVSFVVPSGNFGNMLAGYYARQMGSCIPIRSLVIASNNNAILPHFISTGTYSVSDTTPTLSPSMDISVSSNFERFLFDIWGRDAAKTAQKFAELSAQKSFTVTPVELAVARTQFSAFSINETQTLDTIRSVFTSDNYVLCPHSAVGYCAAQQFRSQPIFDGEDIVVLATAHMGKFVEGVCSSLGSSSDDGVLRDALQGCIPGELRALVELSEQGGHRRTDIANDLEAVKDYMRKHMKCSV